MTKWNLSHVCPNCKVQHESFSGGPILPGVLKIGYGDELNESVRVVNHCNACNVNYEGKIVIRQDKKVKRNVLAKVECKLI